MQIVIQLLNATVFKLALTLVCDVHKLDCNLLFGFFVSGYVYLTEASLANDFSNFVLI